MQTFRKLPTAKPNSAANARTSVGGRSAKRPLINPESIQNHAFSCKTLGYPRHSTLSKLNCEPSITQKCADCRCDLGGIVSDVQPRRAVNENFRESADTAGDHRNAHA